MKTVRLELNKIILDPKIQPRVELDDSHIEDLKNDLMEGAVLPPVVVFYDGINYRLAEGFHRYFAHQRAGLIEIEAEIREGGERDAQLYAVGSNATHGKRRTNADKRRAVATLLKDEEWGKWSDRHIAEVCRVSQPLVSDVRKELTESGFQFPTTRKCSNGRAMDVSQIGANRGQESPQTEPSAGETSNDVQDEAHKNEAQPPTGETPEAGHPSEESPQVVSPETGADPTDASESGGETQDGTSELAPDDGGQPQNDASPGESESGNESDEEPEPPSGEVSPGDAQESPSQGPGDSSSPVDDDIQTLKDKLATLEAALQAKDLELKEKDSRISELEEKVQQLEANNAYYVKEIEAYEKEEMAREIASRMKPKHGGMPLHG
jgi:hypothetical protein